MRFNPRAAEQYLARIFARLADAPERWALYSILIGVFGGGTIFSFVEDKISMPDGWWWAFVSLTTVGYGDISPQTTAIRFLAGFVIASGVIAIAIITGAIGGRIASARTAKLLATATGTPEKHDDLQMLAQHLRDNADQLDAVALEIKQKEEADA